LLIVLGGDQGYYGFMMIRPEASNGRMFRGREYDSLSHFFPEEKWVRVIDYWGRRGWKIGYRDYVRAPCQYKGQKERGHGGDIWILYDHDGSIGTVHPEMYRVGD